MGDQRGACNANIERFLVVKIALPALVLISLASFFAQCSSNNNQSSPQSTNSNYSQAASNETANKEGLHKIPYNEVLETIATFSKQAGINNLKEAKLSNSETEIRIWKGDGLAYPRCFVLKFESGRDDAFLLAPKIVDGKGVIDNKRSAVYVRTPFNSPRSGWDKLSSSLKEQGIGSSVELTLDKTDNVDPDGELIVIEMKTESRYTMAYYTESTETKDGKKAFGICRTIEYEFGSQLGCRG